jgi:hypothetical protein
MSELLAPLSPPFDFLFPIADATHEMLLAKRLSMLASRLARGAEIELTLCNND